MGALKRLLLSPLRRRTGRSASSSEVPAKRLPRGPGPYRQRAGLSPEVRHAQHVLDDAIEGLGRLGPTTAAISRVVAAARRLGQLEEAAARALDGV